MRHAEVSIIHRIGDTPERVGCQADTPDSQNSLYYSWGSFASPYAVLMFVLAHPPHSPTGNRERRGGKSAPLVLLDVVCIP